MKKMTLIMILLSSMLVMSACSDEKADETKDKPSDTTEDNNDSDSSTDEKEDDTDDKQDSSDNESKEEGANELGIEEGDQLDLGIGDTGKIDSIHGVFELTLDAAKIIKDELDGEESQLDDLILLDLTLKNTSDETLDVEDIMGNFEVRDMIDGTGFPDGAEYFDSVDKLTGELAPGEELKGQFITDIYDKDEYYFREQSGFSSSGQSNSVIFTFKADEAK